MRKVREVLRLKHELGLSYRTISAATGASKSTGGRLCAAGRAGWHRLADCRKRSTMPNSSGFYFRLRRQLRRRVRPSILPEIQRELKRRSVTLSLLWQEYQAEQPNGYSYTRFCELYAAWCRRLAPTMRQTHAAGDKLFVDWAGDTVALTDAASGKEHRAHVFVAALGASNFTYAEARWGETLADWIAAHVHAFAAIGGVPQALVPDNLKAGITQPSRYEPGINRTYQELADHYGCVVLPARMRHPRDKAKVEVAVQIVERFVLAKLRNRTFFSLADLNAAIRECVAAINAKIMRHIGSLEQPALFYPFLPFSTTNTTARAASTQKKKPMANGSSVPS